MTSLSDKTKELQMLQLVAYALTLLGSSGYVFALFVPVTILFLSLFLCFMVLGWSCALEYRKCKVSW